MLHYVSMFKTTLLIASAMINHRIKLTDQQARNSVEIISSINLGVK